MSDTAAGVPLESITHIIQVALTPVFLLSGIGTLLNVFTARLARVTDHMEHTEELYRSRKAEGGDAAELRSHLHRLRRRTFALDSAVALGISAGGSTAGAAFMLFVGALRESGAAWVLLVLFGLALIFTVAALTAFLGEVVLSWHGLRDEGPLPRPKNPVRHG